MGEIYNSSNEGIYCLHSLHWYEETTKCQKLMAKKRLFFHCHVISNIFMRDRFQAITKCLHLTNSATYMQNQDEPGYDKMRQLRWLLTAIHDAFMWEWTLGKYVIIDEMMICYKDSYCLALQYMPKKPHKWDIKVWCLADATSIFFNNF